jgi:hypothetical protein
MEVNIMNAMELNLQPRSQQDEPLLLPPDELQLRRAYFYATPGTYPTAPTDIFRELEKDQAALFVRQGVIFADKTVIPVFVAKEVQDEQYH